MNKILGFGLSCLFFGVPSFLSAETVDECLAYDTSHSEMIEICESALALGNHSAQTESQLQDYLGYALYQLNRCEEAFPRFEKAISLWPENAEAWEDRAWCHWDLDNHASAVADFDQAFDIEATASRLAGKASSFSMVDEANYLEAVELIQAAQAMDPEYRFALREEGWIHIRADQPELAIGVFERAVANDSEDGYAYLGLGRALAEDNNFAEAETALVKAIEIFPNRPAFLAELAYVERNLEKYSESLETANRALEIDATNDEALVQKFFTLIELERTDEAIETMELARSSHPNSRFVLDRSLTLLDELDRHELAIKHARAGLEVFQNDADLFVDLSHHLIQINHLEEGEEAARNAIQSDPNTVFGYYNLAIVLLDQDQQDASLEAIQSAIDNGLTKSDYGDYVSYAFDSQGMVFGLRASRFAFQ